MKSLMFAAAALAAWTPVTAAQHEGHNKAREITLQGCVTPAERGTYVLSAVTHRAAPDSPHIPEFAHGRQIFFWLDDDADVKKNMRRMVEVRGELTKVEESEVEVKAGRHADGGMVVEFEGPGRDVRTSARTGGVAVGTAGAPEKNDLKTYLIRVDVKSVKATGTC